MTNTELHEKLVELLMEKGFGVEGANIAADHLIANGVTINQWIPVTERLPKNTNDVLAIVLGDGCQQVLVGWYFAKYDKWRIYPPCTGRDPWIVTHWMPLPKPPKEGNNA